MIFWRDVYRVLRRTFDYSGRSSRAEFWWWMRVLFRAVLVSSVAMVVIEMVVQSVLDLGMLVFAALVNSGILVAVLGFFPAMSLTVRRLHDTGRSGEAMLVWFVAPLFAWIVFLGIAWVTLSIALVGGDPSVAVIAFYASLGVAVAVTIAVACWAIWWLQRDGDDGPNRFGDVPR